MKKDHVVPLGALFLVLFAIMGSGPSRKEFKACEADKVKMQSQLDHFERVDVCSGILEEYVASGTRRTALCASMTKYDSPVTTQD